MTLNPYQGLKLADCQRRSRSAPVPMTLNPYQGLKRTLSLCWIKIFSCSNDIESLSGIETKLIFHLISQLQVPMTLNPYQGLKRIVSFGHLFDVVVPMTLNPYQGLKQA
ncbi:MAG: hypothetical protein ACLGGO_05700 [Coleofasciculus sp.]